MKAVIFDFNGTLFFDSDIHEEAWRIYLNRLTKRDISNEEIKNYVHGRSNAATLTHYAQKELSIEEIATMGDEKESIYRDLCLGDKENLKLVDGAKDFLDLLKNDQIPFTIATASGEDNVDFYFRTLGLDRWFDKSKIIFDDGTFPGKPQPDIYLKAAALLKMPPKDCIVFEDALSGIQAANAAGVKTIVAVGSTFSSDFLNDLKEVSCVIDDFRMIDFIWSDIYSK